MRQHSPHLPSGALITAHTSSYAPLSTWEWNSWDTAERGSIKRIMNSQLNDDLKQAIKARYERKYGPVTIDYEEFAAETESVTRIRYTMRQEDGSSLRFKGRAAYADQHLYLEVHCTLSSRSSQ